MSKLTITALTATFLSSLATTACIRQDPPPDEIRRAIPTAEQVRIKLPQSQARALGELSSYYVVTRDVTRTLNGGSAWVLVLIHTIVQYPVTTIQGDTYTWGPWSGALDPAEYRLDVTANADGTFDYALAGKSKLEAGASYETVISGHADPRPGHLQGNGDFTIDFDAGKRVNPIDSGDARGHVTVTYDLAARQLDLVAVSSDANGNPATAEYAYQETASGGGDMVFAITADVGGTALAENLVLRSRWQADGAGRGDARLAGGDLGSDQAIASECWSTMFKRVFYTDSVDFLATEGDQASCAYATADLPPL
jgi:hypothetical protein